MARLFRRDRSAQPPRTGPGSVTGRQPSGIHILSEVDDWVPKEIARGGRESAAAETTASDWLPANLPEPTSEPPPPSRKRSTITEVPPEMLAAPAPAEPDLEAAVEQMKGAVEEARAEAARLRAQLEALQAARAPAAPPPSAAPPPAPAEPPPAGAVNLNTASVEELMTLPGVTRRAATQIIEHRPFASLDGLLEVPGFHAGRVARFEGRATV